jgi:cell division protein FtsB
MLMVNHFFKKAESGGVSVKMVTKDTKVLNQIQIEELRKQLVKSPEVEKTLIDQIKDLRKKLTKKKLTEDEEYVEIASKQHNLLTKIAEDTKETLKKAIQ